MDGCWDDIENKLVMPDCEVKYELDPYSYHGVRFSGRCFDTASWALLLYGTVTCLYLRSVEALHS